MTAFHETGTLIAALEGDAETVRTRVLEMLPGERALLLAACRAIERTIIEVGIVRLATDEHMDAWQRGEVTHRGEEEEDA